MTCPDGTADESQPHAPTSSPETKESAGSANTPAPTPSTTSNPNPHTQTSPGNQPTGAPPTWSPPAGPEDAPPPDANAPATQDDEHDHPTNPTHETGDWTCPTHGTATFVLLDATHGTARCLTCNEPMTRTPETWDQLLNYQHPPTTQPGDTSW